jgi:gas vesicle protein GvpK
LSAERLTAPWHAVTGSSDGPLDLTDRLSGDLSSLDDFARELGESTRPAARAASGFLPPRINADQETVEKDLAKLVLALIDLVRRLMERQAARRVNAGSLSDDQVERMGETFLRLDRRMAELKTTFGLEGEDLNLSLGSLKDLL